MDIAEHKTNHLLLTAGSGTLLIYMASTGGPTRTVFLTPALLLQATLIFIWLWGINNKKTNPSAVSETLGLSLPGFLLWSFFVLSGVSVLFSVYRSQSLFALVQLLGYIAFFHMAASLAARRDRNIILGAGITAGSILSVVGILQYFNIVPHPWWALDNCLSATFINHNHFSGYLEIAIPAALGLSVSLRKRQSPVALFLVVLLAVIVMSIAFVLAQSRGGWISLGTGLFAMTTVLSAKRLLPRWSLFAYVIILAAVFITAYLKEDNVSERIESMTSSFEQELDKETSLGTRFAIWKDTIRIVRDHPLSGTGIGTFHWSFIGHRTKAVHSTRPYYVYNEYLQAAAESGVPATIIMIAFILAVLVIGYRSSSATMIGCATGILSLALHGLIDFNFHIPSNLLFFILCAGFIIHSKNNER